MKLSCVFLNETKSSWQWSETKCVYTVYANKVNFVRSDCSIMCNRLICVVYAAMLNAAFCMLDEEKGEEAYRRQEAGG